MILYKRGFYYGLMETFESSLCPLVPLPRSPSIHRSDVVFNKMMGVYLLITRPLSPKGGPREDEKSAWENLGGSKAGHAGQTRDQLIQKNTKCFYKAGYATK